MRGSDRDPEYRRSCRLRHRNIPPADRCRVPKARVALLSFPLPVNTHSPGILYIPYLLLRQLVVHRLAIRLPAFAYPWFARYSTHRPRHLADIIWAVPDAIRKLTSSCPLFTVPSVGFSDMA